MRWRSPAERYRCVQRLIQCFEERLIFLSLGYVGRELLCYTRTTCQVVVLFSVHIAPAKWVQPNNKLLRTISVLWCEPKDRLTRNVLAFNEEANDNVPLSSWKTLRIGQSFSTTKSSSLALA